MALHLDRGSVDLEVRDVDLRQALELLFLQMGARYVLPPEVQGTATLDIHHATYRQALELLLGHEFIYSIGPHNTVFVHQRGTTWRPGHEEAA